MRIYAKYLNTLRLRLFKGRIDEFGCSSGECLDRSYGIRCALRIDFELGDA